MNKTYWINSFSDPLELVHTGLRALLPHPKHQLVPCILPAGPQWQTWVQSTTDENNLKQQKRENRDSRVSYSLRNHA